MKNSNPYGVKIGDVWVENDLRHPRRLKVLEFVPGVLCNGVGYVELENLVTGKRTKARLDRFNGRKGGYKEERHDE